MTKNTRKYNKKERKTDKWDACIVKVSEQHSMSLKYNECIQTSLHRMVWADRIALPMTIDNCVTVCHDLLVQTLLITHNDVIHR